MPQLDYTYFIDLIFWSLVTFFLLYFTAIKSFCHNIENILKTRKNRIDKINNDIESITREKSVIEKKILKTNDSFNNKIIDLRKNEEIKFLQKESVIKSEFNLKVTHLKEEYNLKNIAASKKFKIDMSKYSDNIEAMIYKFITK